MKWAEHLIYFDYDVLVILAVYRFVVEEFGAGSALSVVREVIDYKR